MPVIHRKSLYQNLPSTFKVTIILPSYRHLTTTTQLLRDPQYYRSDFQSQGAGFSSTYDPDQPTKGPLAQASKHGAPRLTPTLLKEHLDKFVVGQDKAKKVVSVAIFNHYQRIREVRRQEAEERAKKEQQARWELRERERRSHPVENEYPGHVESVDLNSLSSVSSRNDDPPEPDLGSLSLSDNIPPSTFIEKSNLLLLGPSGVGKTYILQTLASVLEVPFATIDCSSLTQAGYIGSDIESSIERLLLASDHNPAKCETGIIFFDEVDKLAKPAVMTHGRDVSGEGVQQGLLKMIEGTTVTVNAKSDRSSKSDSGRSGNDRLERGARESSSAMSQGPGKTEQFTIDTRNILFVFAGAFVGLDKIISDRLSAGASIGFGARLRNIGSPSIKSTTISQPRSANSTHHSSSSRKLPASPPVLNPLRNLIPTDLQNYGLIPELIGRIPILTSLDPLSLPHLISILTEPKNSLVKQYTSLLQTSNIQLKFTTGALWGIAERALYGEIKSRYNQDRKSSSPSSSNRDELIKLDEEDTHPNVNATGARGLRAIMEQVLFNLMFKGPGSAIRYSLIDEAFVRDQQNSRDSDHSAHNLDGAEENNDGEGALPRCWSRGQGRAWEEAFEIEEERWRRRIASDDDYGDNNNGGGDVDEKQRETVSFQTFRKVGSSGM